MVADEHAMPYYGRGKSPGANGGEGKDGGNRFEPYMTMQVVSGKSPVTLSAYRIAAGESQTHYLRAVMENGQTSRLEHWRAASGQGPQFGGKHSGDGWSGRAVRHVKVGGPHGASHDGGAEADPDKAVRPYAITAKDGRTATANMATVLKNIKPCHVKCGDAKGAGPSRRRTCALCFSPTYGWTAPRSCSNTSRRRTAPGGREAGHRWWNTSRPRPRGPTWRRVCSGSALRWSWSTCGDTARRRRRRTESRSHDSAARLRRLPPAARDRRQWGSRCAADRARRFGSPWRGATKGKTAAIPPGSAHPDAGTGTTPGTARSA